jgi:S1-C subfamily serine protease
MAEIRKPTFKWLGGEMGRCAVLAASVCLLLASACMAADGGGFMGRPLPGQPTQQATSEIADWSSVALDGLGSRVIRDTLLKLPSLQDSVKTRGAKDVAIYKKASSGVVLVATSQGLGSGAYLGTDLILTNLHVVKGSTQVGVVFKPSEEGGKIDPSSMVRADVIRIDPLRDLALLKVALAPQAAHPLDLGTEAEIQVGADVHAIGHPDGEAWTYTRGLISQIRKGFVWEADGDAHRADVIQTQTPINPGNSGGPLLSESGKLIGINSFKESGEGLNFAVALNEISAFLNLPNAQVSSLSRTCKPTRLYQGRNQDNSGELTQIDSNCDGKADISILLPDDRSKPRSRVKSLWTDSSCGVKSISRSFATSPTLPNPPPPTLQ